MPRKICVLGSLNMDLVSKADILPVIGETKHGNLFFETAGGKGANQAVAASKMGANVSMIGRTGKDSYAHRLQKSLQHYNVNIDFISEDIETSSGIANIWINGHGNNSILVIAGANGTISQHNIDKAQKAIADADFLICQLEIPINIVQYAFECAQKYNTKTILNPAPARALPQELINATDILIPNETELAILTEKNPNHSHDYKTLAIDYYQQNKTLSALLVTLGDKGAILIDKNGATHTPAFSVKAINTTAAGDTYIGAFIAALSQGKTKEAAMKFAAAAAALTVTKEGAQDSIPEKKDVINFLNHNNTANTR